MKAAACFVPLLCAALSGAGGWPEELDAAFAIGSERSLIGANDCGLVNGHVTFNGRIDDVARIQGMYAPPYFCNDFQLVLLFNGRRVTADRYTWRPEMLVREGRRGDWRIESRLCPLDGERGAVMEVEFENASGSAADMDVRVDVVGTVGQRERWGFGKPTSGMDVRDGMFVVESSSPVCIAVASSEGPSNDVHYAAVPPGGRRRLHFVAAIGAPQEAVAAAKAAAKDPSAAMRAAVDGWRRRVKRLADRMPEFETDNAALRQVYCRSLLHLLLTEWNVDELALKPYYATGGMNGGCTCNYLWNFGGPYRLWPLLDPEALKAHLRTFLKLDLGSCFAFAPADGSPLGPYYPVNQEKMIFLIDAYARETGDLSFLRETVAGKAVLEHVVDMALAHDDISAPASLADYGSSNSHLELRREYKYNGVMPDLNLRRIALLYLADGLCRMAGHAPEVDLVGRARALKRLVRERLWDGDARWFAVVCDDGRRDLRYTMQMFKALGWGNKVLDKDVADALVAHLMNPKEFLGEYGVHSLSKLDPAYDENDVDNGGPGACPSFAPAIVDRLYRDGYDREAETVFMRLLWLGDRLPYWGDSQYADRPDYRRDTPLQCDVEGAALAQTIMFGMFGVEVQDDFSVEIRPRLPATAGYIALKGLRVAGRNLDVKCSRAAGIEVRDGAEVRNGPLGGRVVLPPSPRLRQAAYLKKRL